MATQLQIRRGTNSQVAAFTGAEGEIVVNTTNDSVHVNDGSTAGGFEMARADLNNVSDTSLNAALTGNTVSALTITTLTLGATAITATGAELNILDGVTSTTAELNYVDGVTSAIQTQIDTKAPLASPTFTGTVTAAALTVDTTTLVVDATNNRVGIGATPLDTFHVKKSSGFLNARIESGDSSGSAVLFQNSTTGTTTGDGLFVGIDSNELGYLYHYENQPLTFGTNNAERLRITSAGDVGIGTSSPNAVTNYTGLTLNNATYGGFIDIENNGTHTFRLISNTTASYIGTIESDPLVFRTADTERLRIDSSGLVGIGNSSPSSYSSSARQLVVGSGSGSNGITITSATNGSSAIFFADGTGSGQQYDCFISANHTDSALLFGTGSTGGTDMTLDSLGNVGIGTSPASALSIYRASGVNAYIEVAGNNNTPGSTSMLFGQDSGNFGYCWNRANQAVLFGTNGTERMRIDASSPSLSLGKTTFNTAGQGLTLIGTPSNPQMYLNKSYSGAVNGLLFYHNNSYVGGLDYTNTATSLATSSDERLKSSIQDADDAGSKIDAIRVRQFDWKVDGTHQDYGFVAQELETVFDHAVHTAEDDMQTKGVDYASLVPMLVKEIQSLRARVAQLENN